jgi:hypothetical protein
MHTKKIAARVLTGLAALLVIVSGLMKLLGSVEVTEGLARVGVGEYRIALGLIEIAGALLFVFPQTRKIGFLLLSCYFAGALATELSHGLPFSALTPLVLIWIAAFVGDRSIFFNAPAPRMKAGV